MYYNHKLYAVNFDKELLSCDVNHPELGMSYEAPPPPKFGNMNNIYLVELSGDLLLITRELDEDSGRSRSLLHHGGADSKWLEVKSLCGQSLFLGENSSICLSSSDFPGCKPNSIYFTDNNITGYAFEGWEPEELYDIGVFTLEDGRVARNYPMKYEMKFPPPWPHLDRAKTASVF